MHTSRGLRLSTIQRVLTTATALALALSLGACTNKAAEPGDLTPSASTPTTTSSPTPEPIAKPERPEAMDTASVEGAIAAAKYFISVYTYATQSGDLDEWNQLSASDCEFCNAVADSVAAVSSVGHRTTGAEVSVDSSWGSEIAPGAFYTASLDVRELPSSELDSSGSTVATTPGAEHSLFIAMAWADGWTIQGVDVDAVGTPSP